MQKQSIFSLGICLLISISAFSRPRAKRVVMIALDGISVSGLKKAHTPHLDALLQQGALSLQTRVVMPSVTLPNWTSHLTGSGPEQHGVVDNGWQIDKIKFPAQTIDSEGYYPSVFQALKEENPACKTAFYYNWINLFYPYNRKHFDEVSYLKEDAYIENYDKAFNFIKANQKSPTIVFLYSVHTDHAGHNFGWGSPQYITSIEEADIQIGVFLNKLKQENLFKDTHFMFLSDHGGIKYGHGGVTSEEMIVPWGITGPGIKEGLKIETSNNTINTAPTLLYLFKINKKPDTWIGQVPYSIFK